MFYFLALYIFIILAALLLVTYNFIGWLASSELMTRKPIFLIIQIITLIITPLVFILIFDDIKNDCCSESAVFSPNHRITVYTLIILSVTAYFISEFRKQILPPLGEVFLNIFLILGIILNTFTAIHMSGTESGFIYVITGNAPIMMLFLLRLMQNRQLLMQYIADNELNTNTPVGRIALRILTAKAIYKYSILLLLTLPVLIILSLILILFGQQPDSAIRAFTDTYKHGLSQLDYQCENVNCGEHFLCSVGAGGHQSIVKPLRYGERNGAKIICNRQLLISNAFEELMQVKHPKLHRIIRRQYNKIGNLVHRYYRFFSIKAISDITYIAMKPLEWIFLFTLYIYDRKPENRIHTQYLSENHRQNIKNNRPLI